MGHSRGVTAQTDEQSSQAGEEEKQTKELIESWSLFHKNGGREKKKRKYKRGEVLTTS